jgi:Domain of unknown function (DUF4404)
MSSDALKDKLNELHAALESAQPPDAELARLLHVLDGDIQSLLARQSLEPINAGETAGLAARAQGISARFAAEHPRLAPVLRELNDMLASIGI